ARFRSQYPLPVALLLHQLRIVTPAGKAHIASIRDLFLVHYAERPVALRHDRPDILTADKNLDETPFGQLPGIRPVEQDLRRIGDLEAEVRDQIAENGIDDFLC